RGRPFGAITSAAPRMIRIALKLPNLQRFLIDIAQQSTARFAVETSRRDDHVAPLLAPLTALGFILNPIVPSLGRRVIGEISRFGDRGQKMVILAVKIRNQVELFSNRFNE